MGINENLLGLSEEEYGEAYHQHFLAIYELYVEMADRISSRRQSSNSFFLSINTAIVVLVGYVQLASQSVNDSSFYWLAALAGMVLCYLWYRLVRSYKGLNSGKFKVIHEMEKKLPLRPYYAEWTALGRGKKPHLYLPFTHIEMAIPWIFFALHLLVLIVAISKGNVLPYK